MARRSALALTSLVVGLLPVAGCSRSGTADSAGTFPRAPIVLISIDTLRSDRLPAYGYRKVETPALDALRRDSLLYTRAYSQVPLTFPSHASMLTGLLPGEVGVRDNLGYRLDTERHPFLPKLLKQLGYKTGGFASAYVLRGETGLSEGFDTYDAAIEVRPEDPLGRSQRPGDETLRSALAWLDTTGDDPFFLFFHIYEPHSPYEPPEPFASRYADKYDGEIAASDAIVGKLLDALRKRGAYDRAIVILLSDHGEGLGDHGEPEHGIFLYREAIQVPLLLKLPGSRLGGETVDAPAELTDVFPTLLALAGGKVPPQERGLSLLELRGAASKPRPIFSETMYPRLHYGWSDLTSLVEDRFHLIQGPDPELYDLAADPEERRNLRDANRRTHAAMAETAARFSAPLQAPGEEDEETRARLESLGYVGTAAPASGPLPDPKSQLGSLRLHGQAFAAYFRKEYSKAAEMFRQLIRENPRMLDAWEHLGISLERLGRPEEARDALVRAMEVSGGSAQVALALSRVLLRLDDLDGAEAHARLGMPASATSAHGVLAEVAVKRNDLATAEAEAKKAMESGGSRIGPLITLAQVQAKQQRLAEALATIDGAARQIALTPGKVEFQGVQFVRGDILGRMGRTAEAIEAFRAEIRDFPWNAGAWSRLVVLCALEGRDREASDALRAMCRENESPDCFAETVRTLRLLGQPEAASALLREARRRFPDSSELAKLTVQG